MKKGSSRYVLLLFVGIILLILIIFIWQLRPSYENIGNVKVPQNIESDYDFATSSNGTAVVFVRDTGNHQPSDDFADSFDNYNQLILKDLSNSQEHILVQSDLIKNLETINFENYPIDKIINISNPHFSLDGSKVYFLAAAWVTSNAVLSVDLNSKAISFITDGNSCVVLTSGSYKGALKVNQHSYLSGGGTKNCYNIINPDTGQKLKDTNECFY